MPTLGSEGTWPREFLLSTASGNRSIENITIVAGAGVIPSGRMLGKVTATGKFDNYDSTASDGTEVCAGLALDDYDASGTADVLAVLVARDAEVRDGKVTAETAGHKAAGKATLEMSGVIFR